MKRSFAILVVLAVGCLGSAQAADLKELLGTAGQQAEQGQNAKAVETLRQALAQAWAKAPLGVRRAVLVNKKAQAFSRYQPRKDNAYSGQEPVVIYVEPMGYKFKRQGDFFNFGFSVDFAFLSSEGKVLAGQRGFGKWSFDAREPAFECFLNLTYTLTGVPPGKYAIETTLHDIHGGQFSFQVPVVFK